MEKSISIWDGIMTIEEQPNIVQTSLEDFVQSFKPA
jgi:hypothetical protein